MTSFEHQQLKGYTIRNLITTIASTAAVVISVMTTYFQLKSDISEVKMTQNTQTRINEIRLKVLEGHVAILQTEVEQLKKHQY